MRAVGAFPSRMMWSLRAFVVPAAAYRTVIRCLLRGLRCKQPRDRLKPIREQEPLREGWSRVLAGLHGEALLAALAL